MTRIIGAVLCWLGLHKWGPWQMCELCNPGNPKHKVKHSYCTRDACAGCRTSLETTFAVKDHRPADREGGER